MVNFWIIGGGKFGRRAMTALGRADASNHLTVIEKQKPVCRRLEKSGIEAVCMDGIQYLERHLTSPHFPDWIIPAIPVHVAYEWISTKLSPGYGIEKLSCPDDVRAALPNPIEGKAGRLYFSIADFKCPANCPEPDDICTYTGKPRPMILHEFLKTIRPENFQPVIVRSRQLAAGVGGYPPAALFDALKQVEASALPVLLCTACSCHGVMDAFVLR